MQRLEAPPPAEQLDRRSRSPQCFRLLLLLLPPPPPPRLLRVPGGNVQDKEEQAIDSRDRLATSD